MARKKGGAATIVRDILKLDLANGMVVNTSPGSLVYMKGDVQKGTANVGSIGTAFARSFTGQDFFLTRYIGGAKGGSIALSLAFPGDIIEITLNQNEAYRLSKGCFLACTDSIKISAAVQLQGILGIGQGEGMIMPLATCLNGQGKLWLGGFGTFEKHELTTESDVMIVDNGIFLACSNNITPSIVQLGTSLWSTFAGGEGFGMEFKGPCVVYTQSKNFNDFLVQISREAPSSFGEGMSKKVQENVGQSIGNALTSWMSSPSTQGGTKPKSKRKVSTKNGKK